MSQIYVVDAGPIIDLLDGSPDAVYLRDSLAETENQVLVHVMNLMEVFYHVSRKIDVLAARGALEQLAADGLIRDATFDAAFFEDAAQLKAQWRKVSLADCCGLALARRLNAQFVTTDRHELEILGAAKVADIFFTR